MIKRIKHIAAALLLTFCSVGFSQTTQEQTPYCRNVESALINNACISIKFNGTFRLANEKNNENSKELLFKNPQDVLEIKIWSDIDSSAASLIANKRLSSIADLINKSGCQGLPDNYFFDSTNQLIRTSAFSLPAGTGYTFRSCNDDMSIYASVYMIVYNTRENTLIEIKYFTPKDNPQNNPEKVIKSVTYSSDAPVQSHTELPLLTLQINDSTMVSDDYILWMGCSKCRLIDRRGNILFTIPGNLVTFLNDKQIIASNSGGYLVLFDKNLDIIEKSNPYFSHHELMVSPDNIIMSLSSEYDSITHTNVSFDKIICFDSNGKYLSTWSTYEHRDELISYMIQDTNIFRFKIKSHRDPEKILEDIAPNFRREKPDSPNREFFHSNAIHIIPENESEKIDSTFRKGNIILSFCNYNDSLASFLAIVDPKNYNILWHYVQKDRKPMHTPVMLPNGHILVYVNSSKEKGDFSLVEEIDPITKTVVWSHIEDFPEEQIRNGRGSCQRLSNGNTLISNNCGYIYEITPDKKIVWQVLVNETKGDGRFLYRAFLFPKEKLNWLINEKY